MPQGGARNSEDGFDLSEAAGVIPRAIHQIFTTLDAHGAEYTVKCSFLELYQARPAEELPSVPERMCLVTAAALLQEPAARALLLTCTLQCQLARMRRSPASALVMPAILLRLGCGATLLSVSAQEESSDLLAVGDAANAKLRMLEDRNGVVVQVRPPEGPVSKAAPCSQQEFH